MHGDLVVVDDVPGEFAERVIEAFHGRPNDAFSLAVSGGDTARACYERLADDAGTQIDWWKVDVYWGDERCVPHDYPESNYHLARVALLEQVGAVNANYPMFCDEGPDPYQLRLGELGRLDVIHLGLGVDGHTASLFPGSAGARRRPRSAGGDERRPERAQPAPADDAHVRGDRARPPRAGDGGRRGEAGGAGPGRRRRSRLPRHPRARATASCGSPTAPPPAERTAEPIARRR